MNARALTGRIPGAVLLFWMVFAPLPNVFGSAQETQLSVANSADGLKSQIGAILESAKDGKLKRFEDLVSDLKIPDKSDWFTSTFGDDLGPKLAPKYKESWDSFQDVLTRSLRTAAAAKPKDVSVTVFGASPFGRANMTALQRSAKIPLTLYEVLIPTHNRGKDTVPGLYAYIGGAFRVLNWATLYKVPGVRPARIRIGGAVQRPKLIHSVDPVLPPDVHATGVVLLRILIDGEGNVEQVDVVSGDPMLTGPAIEAVRQWKYQPTTLNGDPVDVETTVSVTLPQK